MQNKLIPYSLIIILIIPIFGINFLMGLIGNILLLIFLVPLLALGLGLLGLNLFKSNIKFCNNCGSTILGTNNSCTYCDYVSINNLEKNNDLSSDASEKIIEIKAEEIN
tara:strand:+ start:562 stop:888 length:327 start_codon:yes stop_codon:yes gene_type:complete